MEAPLRVGIIGCGAIAREVHIPSYSRCTAVVELVAAADTELDRARESAKDWSIPHAFGSYEEMLRSVELDAVSVCAPNKFHAPATVAALEAGCHVLCEKPPGVTVSDVAHMARTAKEVGRLLSFRFHHRHTPAVEILKRFCDAKELGQIYAARAVAIRRRGIPGWGSFTDQEVQGGGALIDIGSHVLDTALHLMGYPEPETVMAAVYQNIGRRHGVGLLGAWDWENNSVEDMAVGMIRFRGGATLAIEAAFAANVERAEAMEVSLKGDYGGADLFPLRIYQERHGALIDVTPVLLPNGDRDGLEIHRFVECCRTGAEPLSTPAEALTLQRIICALYESAEAGEAVKISEPAGITSQLAEGSHPTAESQPPAMPPPPDIQSKSARPFEENHV